MTDEKALVAVLMGSESDWETMKHSVSTLEALGIACEARIMSAHRSPDLVLKYSEEAEARGLKTIICGAGMSAALGGLVAAKTILPVFGVPLSNAALSGFDSLLAMSQMPRGVPVGVLALDRAGAVNAALLSAAVIALSDEKVRDNLRAYRAKQTADVLKRTDPTIPA